MLEVLLAFILGVLVGCVVTVIGIGLALKDASK